MLEYKPIRIQIVQEAAVTLGPIFNTPAEAADYLADKAELQKEPEEVFVMLALDTKNRLIGAFEVSRGNLSSSLVHPRELFKRALLVNAAGIIIAHNHPSGDLTPSQNDLETTKRLAEAGDLLGVEVLDHLIVGPCAFTGERGRFLSFRNQGLL